MQRKIYELTFWIRQGKGEETLNKISLLMEEFNFELIKKIPLRTKEMAYPIMKDKIGDFGTVYFYGLPSKIEDFKKKIGKINNILRFVILKRKALKGLDDESHRTVVDSVSINEPQ